MNIYKTVFHGSLWMMTMRWSLRLAGLASVVVLARLLHPEDFGIIAMASILIGALSNLTGVGVGAMLIREANIDDTDINTAWTIKVIQGALLAIVVAASATYVSAYFREPRLTDVIYVCALALLIAGFENMGITLLRKELDFAREFRFLLIVRLAGVLITIALALIMRNYWALALARPLGAVLRVTLSYTMHKFRPRFSLRSYRRFSRFSVFVVLSNLARFITNKADVFIVGSTGTATQMGLYNVAADVSSIPGTEISSSVGRAMFPALSRFKHSGSNQADLNAAFLQIIASVVIACVPLGIGMWLVAHDFVRVLFGERWAAAADLMGILGIYGTLTSLINISIGHVLIVTGHEYRQAATLWLRCVLLIVGALIGMPYGMTGIAIGATASGIIMFFVAIVVLKATLRLTYADFVRIYWRPVLASVAMSIAVHYTIQGLMDVPAGLRLTISVAAGAFVYTSAVLVLWLLAGRPPGPEATVWTTLAKRLKKNPTES